MSQCAVNDSAANACRIYTNRVKSIVYSKTGINPNTTIKPSDKPDLKTNIRIREAIAQKLYTHLESVGMPTLFNPEVPDAFIMGIQRRLVEENGLMLRDDILEMMNLKMLTMVYKKVSKIIDADSKLTPFDKEWMPVLGMITKRDKTGLIRDYIEKTREISDNAYSNHVPFTKSVNNTLAKMGLDIKNTIESLGLSAEDVITSTGLRGVKNKRTGESVRILSIAEPAVYKKDRTGRETSVLEKAATYNTLEEVTGNKIKEPVSLEDLSINDPVELAKAIYETYEHLASELLSGRARFIQPAVIPKRGTSERKKISKNLEEMQKYGKLGMEYPFVQSITHTDGYVYDYILVKNGEGKTLPSGENREVYTAYLTRKREGAGTKKKTLINYIAEGDKGKFYNEDIINEIIPQGFYRAKSHKVTDILTDKIDKEGSPITYGFNDWQKFERMEDQPHQGEMNRKGKMVGSLMNPTWKAVEEYRNMLKDLLIKMEGEVKENEAQWQKEIDRQKKVYGVESTEAILEKLKKISGLDASLWVDDNDNIHTPGSFMGGIGQNYFPAKFRDESVWNALKKTISELSQQIGKMTEDFDEMEEGSERNELENAIEKGKEKIQAIQDVYDESVGESERDPKQLMASRSIYSKHRSTIMPYKEMRTDIKVITEYINHSFRALEINKLKLGLIKALSSIPPVDVYEVEGVAKKGKSLEIFAENGKVMWVPKSLKSLKGASISTARRKVKAMGGTMRKDRVDLNMHDFVINRTKIALNDPHTEARFSADKVANLLNKMPTKRNWSAEAVKETIITLNSFSASFFLNWATALVNNTQRFNELVTFGGEVTMAAKDALKGGETKKMWEDRAANAGVTNIVNVFNEILVGGMGGETDIQDLLFAPGGPYGVPFTDMEVGIKIPIPWKGTFNWLDLKKMGRTSFIEKGNSVTDRIINRIIQRRGDTMERLLAKQEGAARNKEREIIIQQMRRSYYNILNNVGNKAELIKEFQVLVGKARKDVVKRGVSAAMGWWPKIARGFGQQHLTMKETERNMRIEACTCNLMVADMLDLLGKDELDENDMPIIGSRFLTEQAKFIARAGTYSSMFGMSQAMLPEAWQGAGQAGLQFKSYPYYQLAHDWQRVTDFVDSEEAKNPAMKTVNLAWRFGQASWRSARYLPMAMFPNVPGVHKIAGGNKKDMTKTEWLKEDQTARAFTTMLYGRVIAPMVAAFLWEASVVGWGHKLLGGKILRGVENPVIGLAIRTLTYGIHMTLVLTDEDEEERLMKSWQRLLLPPFISWLTEALYTAGKGIKKAF